LSLAQLQSRKKLWRNYGKFHQIVRPWWANRQLWRIFAKKQKNGLPAAARFILYFA